MTFEYPLFLLLLPLALLPLFRGNRSNRGVPFPVERIVSRIRPSARRRVFAFLPLGNVLALTLVVLSLAGPKSGTSTHQVSSTGIDIELLLDVSASMSRTDLVPGKTRLDVATSVIDRFIDGRPDDRIGLVTFAKYPRLVCPLTLDHQALRESLARLETVRDRQESRTTAIGVALAAAALRLKKEDDSDRERIIVLLTDGQEEEHVIEPIEAAELARALGVRVYVISISKSSGKWTQELRDLGKLTGGDGFAATDAGSLVNAYRRIDTLEKKEVLETRYTEWTARHGVLLWLVLLLLCLQVPVQAFVFRRVP